MFLRIMTPVKWLCMYAVFQFTLVHIPQNAFLVYTHGNV